MIDHVEQLLEQLTTVCGALRLSMRSDGLLLGEASADSKQRLEQILQELADTGESELLQAFTEPEKGRRRKYKRLKKAKPSGDGLMGASQRPNSLLYSLESDP